MLGKILKQELQTGAWCMRSEERKKDNYSSVSTW